MLLVLICRTPASRDRSFEWAATSKRMYQCGAGPRCFGQWVLLPGVHFWIDEPRLLLYACPLARICLLTFSSILLKSVRNIPGASQCSAHATVRREGTE
jgi:hypothetical protein